MELSLTKLFGGSRYLVQSIHAKKLQVGIFSQLGWISPLLITWNRSVRTAPISLQESGGGEKEVTRQTKSPHWAM